ncbi:TonB-dependent receptor domain-containing protein [Dokdonella sp.]|uniref:TonB-dependent receptor domain-containing protein n=1 Tax=Dokdonella sp. TaxID=2291710 RepID=UPI003783A590
MRTNAARRAVVTRDRHSRRALLRSVGGRWLLAACLSCTAAGAFAQRADVNVVADADDAFGYEAAGESIGLYDAQNVRGFSPSRAGNVRVEGLYFDWQAKFTDDVLSSERIDVGLAAAGRPFASPSGIADYRLKRANDTHADASVAFGPFDARRIAVEAGRRSSDGMIGMHIGGTNDWPSTGAASTGRESGFGIVADIVAGDGMQALVFLDRQRYWHGYSDPYFHVSGEALPREVPRRTRLSQEWARENGSNANQGVLLSLKLSATLELRAGLFQSSWKPTESFDTFILDVDRPGEARQIVSASADGERTSTSGEVRVVQDWRVAGVEQRSTWSVRGRDLARRYGSDVEVDLGPVVPGAYTPVARPELQYLPQDRAGLRQLGHGYDHRIRWSPRFETNVGLQRVDTSNDLQAASSPQVGSSGSMLLRSLGGRFALSDEWLAFANYTEGSESLGIAPSIAANPGELLPDVRSTQQEIGLSYRMDDLLVVQANAFRLRRPHADFDDANTYRAVGNLDNHGIEISLRSRPTARLTLLGGLLWMDAKVGGHEAMRASARPVGVPGRQALLYADYLLSPRHGISVDANVTYQGDALVDVRSGLRAPSRTNVASGLRWMSSDRERPLALRIGVDNLFDGYGWIVDRSGGLQYSPPRSVSLSISRGF